MPFFQSWMIDRLCLLIPLWLSLSVHEWAHAWTAWKLGDDTAEKAGRLTLNPLAHVDPLGTLLLPLLGIPFGWAKPVPIQPHRFTQRVSMNTGMMLTAVAGPVSNFCLAAACIVLAALLIHFQILADEVGQGVVTLLRSLIFMNIVLAIFNVLPIPPLDGSRVAEAMMPDALRPAWEGFCRLGPVALIAVILLPMYSGINLFQLPMEIAQQIVHELVLLLGR
jgi:Zn-dependent protease